MKGCLIEVKSSIDLKLVTSIQTFKSVFDLLAKKMSSPSFGETTEMNVLLSFDSIKSEFRVVLPSERPRRLKIKFVFAWQREIKQQGLRRRKILFLCEWFLVGNGRSTIVRTVNWKPSGAISTELPSFTYAQPFQPIPSFLSLRSTLSLFFLTFPRF